MNTNNNSYIITGNGLSVIINGKPYTVDDTNPNYTAIKTAVRSGDWDIIPDLINLTTVMAKYVATNPDVLVDVAKSTIYYKNEAIHNSLVDRIFDMMKDGFSIEPMTNLLSNLYNNVSMKAIDELYSFLEYGKMPITEDGHFLAYKRVNADYTSVYDSTTTNNIGEVTSLPRYKVDDRSEVTCSFGLHICSFEYLKSYPGARVIVVKVNPADVVSIPTDYNNTKARVCRYEVINELTFEEAGLNSHSFGTSVYTDYDQYDDEESDDSEINLEMDEMASDLIDMIDQAFNAVFVTTPPEQKEPTEVETPVSDWFRFGYTNGYNAGTKKLDRAPDCRLEDDETGTMTVGNIVDVNVGYSTGYKDGRSHKRRKYLKTPNPTTV